MGENQKFKEHGVKDLWVKIKSSRKYGVKHLWVKIKISRNMVSNIYG
jgi:hypothetical protein